MNARILALGLTTALAWTPIEVRAENSALEKNVAAMEAITSKFATLDSFLHDRKAMAEYEAVLTQAYGSKRFPCGGMSDVLGQVRGWIAIQPQIAARLWAPAPKRGPQTVAAGVRVMPTPRLFHGLWNDLARSGCPDSGCGTGSMTVPGRWALALGGAGFYFAEKQGSAFDGQGLWISQGERQNQRARVLHTSPALLAALFGGRSTAAKNLQTVLGKGPNVLFADPQAGKLRSLGNPNQAVPANQVRFSDPAAGRLAAVLPDSCRRTAGAGSRGIASGSNGSGGSAAPISASSSPSSNSGGSYGGGSGGAPAGGPVAVAQAALGDVLVNLNAGDKTPNPQKYQNYEINLDKVLKNDSDPERRAQAALGLGILRRIGREPATEGRVLAGAGLPSGGSTAAPKWSPSSVGGLVSALRDTSPKVRGHAALALAEPNASGAPKVGQIQPTPASKLVIPSVPGAQPYVSLGHMRNALGEAYRDPKRLSMDNGQNLYNYTGPEIVEQRAFEGTIRNGLEMTPPAKDKMWNEAKNEQAKGEKTEVDRIADDYLSHNQIATSEAAIQELKGRLSANPQLFDDVLKAIERKIVATCKDCNENENSR